MYLMGITFCWWPILQFVCLGSMVVVAKSSFTLLSC